MTKKYSKKRSAKSRKYGGKLAVLDNSQIEQRNNMSGYVQNMKSNSSISPNKNINARVQITEKELNNLVKYQLIGFVPYIKNGKHILLEKFGEFLATYKVETYNDSLKVLDDLLNEINQQENINITSQQILGKVKVNNDKDKKSVMNTIILLKFAWNMSSDKEFEAIFNSMKGGNEMVPSNGESSNSRSNRSPIVIMLGILIMFYSLFALYENISNLYTILEQLHINNPTQIEADNIFSLEVFYLRVSEIFLGTFESTMQSMQTVALSRVQTILQDVTDSTRSMAGTELNLGLSNGLTGLFTGTTTTAVNEQAARAGEFHARQAMERAVFDVNTNFQQSRLQVSSVYNTIIIGLNFMSTSALLLINQYDSNIVNRYTIMASTGLSGGLLRGAGTISIITTVSNISLAGSSVIRLITGTEDTTTGPLDSSTYSNTNGYSANNTQLIPDAIANYSQFTQNNIRQRTSFAIVTPEGSDDEDGFNGGRRKKRRSRKHKRSKKHKRSRRHKRSRKH